MPEERFFHIDLDAFFASVECLDHSEYRGKPLIIGRVGPRCVCSTCSYEARKFGVHSAMPMSMALRLCPNAITVPGNMKRYSEKSKEVMAIIRAFAPGFIQASIDEAYLDMTGMETVYGKPRAAGYLLKDKIFNETGLTVSIGIGSSHFIAKLASDYHKPNGLTYVAKGREIEFVDTVGIKKLWGVGKVMQQNLEKRHIYSTQDIREFSCESLQGFFGKASGSYLYQICRGIDPGIISADTKTHSISTETTYYPDLFEADAINQYLLQMSQEVTFRALDEGFMAKTVGVKIRYGDFTTTSIQATPTEGIYNSGEVYALAKELFWKKYNGSGIRLLGLGLYQMYEGDSPEQGELFAEDREKRRKLEKTILSLQKKGCLLQRAGTLAQGKVEDDD